MTPSPPHAPRKIVHVDMDAFYASVEQRDEPALRGRPVVVAWRGKRSVVCAASYEARDYGVRSAMPALRAERLCPDAVFVAPDFSRYKVVSQAVHAILRRHTSIIEPLSLDEAYLDVTRNRSGLSSATAVAQAIRAQIRDELHLTASAGVAPNKFLAKLASDWNKPDGLFVIRPHQAEMLIGPLPVSRLPGVGPVMEKRLLALGLKRVEDIRAANAAWLESELGRFGPWLRQLAQGQDERAVSSHRERLSVSAEDTFETDLPLAELAPHIRRMADRCWRAASRLRRPAHTVILKLKTADFRILTRSQTLGRAVGGETDLGEIALALCARVELPSSTHYRLAGVGLSGFREEPDHHPQAELSFAPAQYSEPVGSAVSDHVTAPAAARAE